MGGEPGRLHHVDGRFDANRRCDGVNAGGCRHGCAVELDNATPLPDESDPQALEFSWHELEADDPTASIEFYHTLFAWESKSDFDMGDKGVYRMFGRDRFTYGGS